MCVYINTAHRVEEPLALSSVTAGHAVGARPGAAVVLRLLVAELQHGAAVGGVGAPTSRRRACTYVTYTNMVMHACIKM